MTRPTKKLKSISSLFSPKKDCGICKGEGLVCEDHPLIAWNSGTTCCGGAGMPCECNEPYLAYLESQKREPANLS